MSQLLRLDVSSAQHHVTAKSTGGRQNAADNRYRDNFLNRRETLSFDAFAACYAWALLSNQVSACFPGQAPSRRRLKHHS
jgi:hypothetical protein